jgi:23S rRNA (adenine2030-N6)-methyltransferase
MNYRHAYHAGNFADVHKHVALVAILARLKRKSAPFAVIDTHAGGGLYELGGKEALASGEAEKGIGKLSGYAAKTAALASYLEVVRGFGPGRYPGSPLIGATLLRPQDRLIVIEKQPDEVAKLRQAIAQFANAEALEDDGYARVPKLVPPPERRGLVLLDPPYESVEELQQMARAFAQAYRRFRQGVYLIWLPLKSTVAAEALAGELKTAGATKLLSLALDIGRGSTEPEARLSASGLLAVNPPYGFEEEMRVVQRELLPLLRRSPSARAGVEWLAGGP